MSRCKYFIEIEDQRSITITDIGNDLSVLNEITYVVEELHAAGLLGDRRLFFYDHTGRLDEILHNGKGKYMGIRL